eukprot:Nk52_evm17s235 gene=Nk52_evmTU17s235
MTFRTKNSKCIHITVLALVLVGFAHIAIVTAIEGKEEVSMIGGKGLPEEVYKGPFFKRCARLCGTGYEEIVGDAEDEKIDFEYDLFCLRATQLICRDWCTICGNEVLTQYHIPAATVHIHHLHNGSSCHCKLRIPIKEKLD